MNEVTLRVTGLTKRFSGVLALRDVSFEVRAEQVVALLGPNGSGKTTLFNVLSGFMSATAGTIHLDGRSIGRMSPKKRVRHGLVRSFQESMALGSFTVAECLTLASAGRRKRTAPTS